MSNTPKPQVDFESFGREFKAKSRKFLAEIENLSKKQLERVLKALTLYPLEHETINLTHREEKIAFDLGVEIFTSKVNMTVAYIGEQATLGTEMINEAEGDTAEERVENAIKESKKEAEIEELKEKVAEVQEKIVEEVPEVVAKVIKPKRKPRKKAVKKVVKDD